MLESVERQGTNIIFCTATAVNGAEHHWIAERFPVVLHTRIDSNSLIRVGTPADEMQEH
jgi:hypothetical protein